MTIEKVVVLKLTTPIGSETYCLYSNGVLATETAMLWSVRAVLDGVVTILILTADAVLVQIASKAGDTGGAPEIGK